MLHLDGPAHQFILRSVQEYRNINHGLCMDFIRTIYASIASRQIAFLLQRGRTTSEASSLTSAAISFAMASNFCTVVVLFGWRPRSRIELMPIVIGFIVLTALECMNEQLIR